MWLTPGRQSIARPSSPCAPFPRVQEVKPYNIRTTVISPGAVSTELLDHISEKGIQEGTKDFVSKIAIGPDTFARAVAFAINEPDNVDINEILFRPTAQPV